MTNQRIFNVTLAGVAAALLCPMFAQARDSYSHVTVIEGSGSLFSQENGTSSVVLNLPIQEGDELATDAGSRAEVELADGSRVQIAGESRVRFDALAGQDESSAEESAVTLVDGSLAAESMLVAKSRALRIDTPDTSVYVSYRGQVRLNRDSSGATSVVVRQGSAEIHTPSGTETVEAGHYVLSGADESPEIVRGSFSRDRFDVWVSDRTGTLLHAYNSVSARYVDGNDYDQDVAVLDDYGQWDYSSTYQTEVWRPTVAAGWSPYSSGFWYYTPAGASWVCDEPWGWFPHHYGNWIFDAAFGSWCWSPAFAYSPAWVYWSYSGSYVGWCPIGSYAFYSPYRNYWGRHSRRSGLDFAINGIFDPARVDFRRGWNFVGVNRLGTRFNRGEISTGRSVVGRLGSAVAISSAPLRVAAGVRNGAIAQKLQAYARTAPQAIARSSRPEESAALAPFLARRDTLPATTLRALESNHVARVDAAPRLLPGPGSLRFAPAPSPDRTPSRLLSGGRFNAAPEAPSRAPEAWRNRPGDQFARDSGERVRDSERRLTRGDSALHTDSSWRSRRADDPRTLDRPPAFSARESARAYSAPAPQPSAVREFRERSFEPPARRIIEGIDRGRAAPRSDWRPESAPRHESTYGPAPRPEFRAAPPPREQARPAPPPPRADAHPDRDRGR